MRPGSLLVAALAATASLAVGSAAHAAFTTPDWARPADAEQADANLTTYEFWNAAPAVENGAYTATTVTNAPTTVVNPNGAGIVGDANADASGSFISSSGSIYSFSSTELIQPRAVIQGYGRGDGFATRFFIQAASYGGLLDPDIEGFITVNGVDVTTLASFAYTELSRVEQDFTPPGGKESIVYAIEHAWSFTLPGNADAYTIDLAWNAESTSFGDFAIDTQVVPEPASLTLAALTAAALLRRRR